MARVASKQGGNLGRMLRPKVTVLKKSALVPAARSRRSRKARKAAAKSR